MTTVSPPRVVDQVTAHRMLRMRELRLARSRFRWPSFTSRHALPISLGVIALVALAAAAVLWQGGYPVFAIPAAILGMTCVGFGIAVAIGGEVAVERDWSRSIDDLTGQLHGRHGWGLAPRLAWFDQHWLGELSPADVAASSGGRSITVVVQGYPVLVVIDPSPLFGQRRPRIEVFLAASLPKLPPCTLAALDEARQWLLAHGFTLVASEAGLRATATTARVGVMGTLINPHQRYEGDYDGNPVRAPPFLSTGDAFALAWVVHAVATTAALLHGVPVAPIP